MITVAIDPGVWAMGWAIFRDRVLVSAGCSKLGHAIGWDHAALACGHANEISRAIWDAKGEMAWGRNVHHDSAGVRLVLEHMVARGPEAPQRPDDLISVMAVGCLTAARLGHVSKTYTAQTWKGSVPKDVHHPRIRAALKPAELDLAADASVAAGKTNAKEVWDAIGIGLFDLGRIDSKGEKRS